MSLFSSTTGLPYFLVYPKKYKNSIRWEEMAREGGGSLRSFLRRQRQLTAVQSVSNQSWDRYLGHFGNWVYFHDALEFDGDLRMSALEITHDPPFYEHLQTRVRNFAAFERWRGSVGQTIGTTISGFWRVLQAFNVELLSVKALRDHGIFLEREAADRCNVSQAKPVFSTHYAAMKKIYIEFTKVDEEGYPVHGAECFMEKNVRITKILPKRPFSCILRYVFGKHRFSNSYI